MQAIKDTIKDVMKDLTSKKSNAEEQFFKLFRQRLDRQERAHVHCVSLRSGIIAVNVDSSAWLYHLSQKKGRLIEQLGVKDIKFRIGEITKNNEEETGNKKSKKKQAGKRR